MKVVQTTVLMIASSLLYLSHHLAESYSSNSLLQTLKCTTERNLLFNKSKYFKIKFLKIKMQLESH